MHRGPLLSYVFTALYELSSLRAQVHVLQEELEPGEAARFTARLQRLEADALQLLEQFENRRPTAAH